VSATPLRKLGGAARRLGRELIGEDVPAPAPRGEMVVTKVSTPDPARLIEVVKAAGGKVTWVRGKA
jgi:hypothetical protein